MIVHYRLEHWGSDQTGVNRTRRFLLEWLSWLWRYIPRPLLARPDVAPLRMGQRADGALVGRDDLETLMASPLAADWVRISEMLLGPVPEGFTFIPKQKSSESASSRTGAAQSRDMVGQKRDRDPDVAEKQEVGLSESGDEEYAAEG